MRAAAGDTAPERCGASNGPHKIRKAAQWRPFSFGLIRVFVFSTKLFSSYPSASCRALLAASTLPALAGGLATVATGSHSTFLPFIHICGPLAIFGPVSGYGSIARARKGFCFLATEPFGPCLLTVRACFLRPESTASPVFEPESHF